MEASLNTHRERPTSNARRNLHAKALPLAPHRGLRLRTLAPGSWLVLQSWFLANTVAPHWLPKRWRHPLAGYLIAALVEVGAVSLTLLTGHLLPVFAVQGALI